MLAVPSCCCCCCPTGPACALCWARSAPTLPPPLLPIAASSRRLLLLLLKVPFGVVCGLPAAAVGQDYVIRRALAQGPGHGPVVEWGHGPGWDPWGAGRRVDVGLQQQQQQQQQQQEQQQQQQQRHTLWTTSWSWCPQLSTMVLMHMPAQLWSNRHPPAPTTTADRHALVHPPPNHAATQLRARIS
jgi:hypothetical protein